MKILLLLAAAAVIIWTLRVLSAGRSQRIKREKGSSERMLACNHCGLHVPENEAIVDGTHIYCCPEHQKLGAKPDE